MRKFELNVYQGMMKFFKLLLEYVPSSSTLECMPNTFSIPC